MTCLPIDRIDRDWQRELASPLFQSSFAAWRELDPALSRFADAEALVLFLRGPGACAEKDRVLVALLRRARSEPLAARIVLQGVLPGLKRLFAQMLCDVREREELWSILLAEVWERICCYPLHRDRRIAANLLLDTRKRTLKPLVRARERPPGIGGWPDAEVPAPPVVDGDVRGLLDAAVEAGAITPVEARLIFRTRIELRPLGAVARSLRISRHTLIVRRLRAEQRLFEHLGYGVVRHRYSTPLRHADGSRTKSPRAVA
jgi:hypothetical protein